jgi:ketosteroid isomerase-like protein
VSTSVEIVREALQAFARGDVEGALKFADPEIECRRVPPLPDPQIYRGAQGVLQMYSDWTADFDGFEMRPLEFLEVGDWVLCDMIQRGRGRASGVPTEGRFWLAWQFAAGKVVRQYAYLTKEQALAEISPSA